MTDDHKPNSDTVPKVYLDEDLSRRLIKRAQELGYVVDFEEDGTLILTKPHVRQ